MEVTVTPAHAVSLALNHAAARFLDGQGASMPTELLRNAFGNEAVGLSSAPCDSRAARDLFAAALERLKIQPHANSGKAADGAFEFAAKYLAQLTSEIEASEAGVGCTLEALIVAVDSAVRDSYMAISSDFDARPTYVIKFRASKGGMRPTIPYMTGMTEVDPARKVTFTFWNEPFGRRHLTALIYVAFHELVCHAFQGAASDRPGDVGADCIWSEGWMDTVAMGLAVKWVTEPTHYLTFLPVLAIVAENEVRQHAQERQEQAEADAARRGRSAFDNFLHIFNTHRDANDASQWTLEKFSLSVNAKASLDDVTQLSAHLATLDLDEIETDVTAAVYGLCVSYMKEPKLEPLLAGLSALSGTPTRIF